MNAADLSIIINSEIIDELDEKIVSKYNDIIKEGFTLSSVSEKVMRDAAKGGYKNGKYDIDEFNKVYSIFSFENDLGQRRYLIVDDKKNIVPESLSKLRFLRFNILTTDFCDRFDKALVYFRANEKYDISLDDIYQISASLKDGVSLKDFLDDVIVKTVTNMEYANAYANKYGPRLKNPKEEIIKKMGIELDKLNVVSYHTLDSLGKVIKGAINYTLDEILTNDDISSCTSLDLMNDEKKNALIDKIQGPQGKKWLRKALSVLRLDKEDKIKKFVPANKVVEEIYDTINGLGLGKINLDNFRSDIVITLAAINGIKNLDDAEKEIFQYNFIEKALTQEEVIDYKKYAYFVNNLKTPIDILNPEYNESLLEEKIKKNRTAIKEKAPKHKNKKQNKKQNKNLSKNLKPKRAPKFIKTKVNKKVRPIEKIANILKTKELESFVSIDNGQIKIDLHQDVAGLMIDRKPLSIKNCVFKFEPTKKDENNVNLYLDSILRENFSVPGLSDYVDKLKENLSLEDLISVNTTENKEEPKDNKNIEQTL